MSRRKRKATFSGEIAFGFVISLVAAALAVALSFALSPAVTLRLLVAGVSLALVVRTIARSGAKTGRIAAVAAWIVAGLGLWFSGVGLPAFALAHALFVWLARSLYSYSRFTEAALDLGLSTLALSFAAFAAVRTESVLLATWSFLLLQSFHAAIPGLVSAWFSPDADEHPTADPNREFARALKAADEALRRIAGERRT